MRQNISEIVEQAMCILEDDSNEGICLDCGNVQDSVEPDACDYKCEDCGAKKVMGAGEIVLQFC